MLLLKEKEEELHIKNMLDKRFWIFESGGIVGDRIWDLMGGEYLDYRRRVKPMLERRIAWYEKKSNKKF